MSNRKPTRGERNHNPGNIDYSPANKWQGLADPPIEQGVARPRFARFLEPKWGIRALMRTLITYHDRHGLNTVEGIINRWAPTVENDTSSYVRFVARRLNVGPSDKIDVYDYDTMISLANAIIFHENAGLIYPVSTMHQAALLSGIQRAQPRPMALTKTITGTSMTASGVALEPIADLAVNLTDTGTQLQAVSGVSTMITVVSVILVVGGLALTIYGRLQVRKKTGE